jgi:hypothetical protein
MSELMMEYDWKTNTNVFDGSFLFGREVRSSLIQVQESESVNLEKVVEKSNGLLKLNNHRLVQGRQIE